MIYRRKKSILLHEEGRNLEEQREHEVYTLEEAQKDEQLTTQLK